MASATPHSNHAPALTIRLASSEDAVAIRHIGSTVFASSFGHSLPSEDLTAYLEDAYSPQSVLDDITNPLKTICVACNAEGQVLGFVTLTEGTIDDCIRSVPRPIELQRLYVDSSAHGRGVGSALVRHVEDMARERGFLTCWLGVWEENHTAQKVYAKLGYSRAGQHEFVTGKIVQTDWILTKKLQLEE